MLHDVRTDFQKMALVLYRDEGLKPMPYALEMDGSGCDIFTMHPLVSGDVLCIGRELSQGRVRVELAGVVEATPENCKAYSEAFGIKVTPASDFGAACF